MKKLLFSFLFITAVCAAQPVKVYLQIGNPPSGNGSYLVLAEDVTQGIRGMNYMVRTSAGEMTARNLEFTMPPGEYTFWIHTGGSWWPWTINGVSGSTVSLKAGDVVTATCELGAIQGHTVNMPDSTQRVDRIFQLVAKLLALGAACGGLVFATRLIWSFYKKIIGGPTWRE